MLGPQRVIAGEPRSGIAVPPGERLYLVVVAAAAALGSLAGMLVGAVCWIGTLAEAGHGW